MNSYKQSLRASSRLARDRLSEATRTHFDECICNRVVSSEFFDSAEQVFTYLSFGSEIETRTLIEESWQRSKLVALPYCVPKTRTMQWFYVSSFDSLVTSPYGIKEPNPHLHEKALATPETLAIVPGLLFDEHGQRLGYGGGFYDVFLHRFEGVSVGLCYEAQLAESFTNNFLTEEHDVPVNYVITERRTLLCTHTRLD